MEHTVSPADFRLFLRNAMQDPSQMSFSSGPRLVTKDLDLSPESSGGFDALIEHIHFSKRFILSYQLVLVVLLLVFAAINWTARLRAWTRRRRLNEKRKEARHHNIGQEDPSGKGGFAVKLRSNGSSSSSSTLEGDALSDDATLKDPAETALLLSKTEHGQNSTWIHILTSKTKAWLVYQPRPIPVFNKPLPSNGASLAVTAFIGLQVFYAFLRVPLSLPMAFVFADRTSLLFVANLPLLYLFAAKNQPLKRLTGYSYEGLNILHRRLGEVMCLLALLHFLGMHVVWYTILRPAGVTLVNMLLMRMILFGIGALFAYEMIYFTSLGSFRQRWYELFLGLHIILQAAGLILLWFHHHGSRPYVGVALAIFLVDRLVYRMSVKSASLLSSLEVMEDKTTVKIRTSIHIDKHRSLLRHLCGASNVVDGWKATEHVFLTVPSLAHKHVLQAHPFTVASSAPTSDEQEIKLELLIRAQSGFSADLVRYAHRHSTVPIRLDGPYGSQSAVHLLEESDHAVIVAGGSGIAVAWPLLDPVLRVHEIDDIENVDKNMKLRKILLIWVIRENSHVSWIGHDRLKSLENRGVTVLIPPPTAEHGHPDLKEIVTDWTNDLEGSIGIVASGPDGLNRVVRNTCSSLISNGRSANIEVEKFGW